MAPSRDGEANHPWKIIESEQGNNVVVVYEKLQVRPQHVLLPMGVNLPQVFCIFERKDKRCFTYLKYTTEHILKSNITHKKYDNKSFQRKY